MPLVGTRANASARAYGFTSTTPEVLGGMVLITPTSIASTGTGNSSSIGANGSVTFSTCATLSLNGVFTANYDNYMISFRWQQNTSSSSLQARLRASGTDSTANTDYNTQQIYASASTVGGVRSTTSGFWDLSASATTYRNGLTMNVYGPYLSQPTAFRTIVINSSVGATIDSDGAGTHELSSSYDGITFYPSGNSITGLVSVYGLVGA